jgi:hypothetical protein
MIHAPESSRGGWKARATKVHVPPVGPLETGFFVGLEAKRDASVGRASAASLPRPAFLRLTPTPSDAPRMVDRRFLAPAADRTSSGVPAMMGTGNRPRSAVVNGIPRLKKARTQPAMEEFSWIHPPAKCLSSGAG